MEELYVILVTEKLILMLAINNKILTISLERAFDDMGIGLKIPKGYEIEVISDGTKKNHISYRPVKEKK